MRFIPYWLIGPFFTAEAGELSDHRVNEAVGPYVLETHWVAVLQGKAIEKGLESPLKN